ncbi:MAG: hypothetical protein H6581_16100 [Bacteroidia bacterium]|nr:hypothetical protein [Bacteroidia bacterium]
MKHSPYRSVTGRGISILLLLAVLILSSCGGGGVGARLARIGRAKFFRWIRYEVGSSKNFSMGSSQVKPGRKIIGFEPSWLIYDSLYLNYPWEMMTDLVVGEYDVNPNTGFSRFDSSMLAFKAKTIIEHAIDVNSDLGILLAVTNYSDFSGNQFNFMTDAARKNLITSLDGIIDEMRLKKGDTDPDKVGIVLDFQNIPPQFSRDYAEFISRLRAGITNEVEGEKCLIYLVLPLKDENYFFDNEFVTKKIRRNVDYYILRGHNYDRILEGEKPGPLVNLHDVKDTIPSRGWDVDSAIHYYSKKSKFPKDSMVVELPFYGRNWKRDSSSMADIRPLRPMSEIFNLIENNPIAYDADSSGAFFALGDTIFWYEDTLTLSRKYDYVKEHGLAGAGIYGLGYGYVLDEAYRNKMWDKIAEKFGETPPRLFFPGLSFFITFLVFAVFWSAISYWEVRYALRAKKSKLWYWILMVVIMIAAIILLYFPLDAVPLKFKLLILLLLVLLPFGRFMRKLIKF